MEIQQSYFQQSSLFQFAKSLLALDLQLSDVPCQIPVVYQRIFNQPIQILH